MKKKKIKCLLFLFALLSFQGCSSSSSINKDDLQFILSDEYVDVYTNKDIVYAYKDNNEATVLYCKNKKIKNVNILSSFIIKNKEYVVKNIHSDAFKNCNKLINIVIPSTIESIENNAFLNCTSLNEITLNKNVSNIGNHVFENCPSLKSINVEEGNSSYYSVDGILYTSNHELKQYPNGLDISEYKIKDDITTILDYAFSYNKYLVTLDLNNVETIGEYAFSHCTSLSEITLNDKIDTISKGAFSYCEKIHNVELTSSIINVEDYAFYGCKELFCIKLTSSIKNVGTAIIGECESAIVIKEQGINDSGFSSSWNKDNRPVYSNATKINPAYIKGLIYNISSTGATVIGHYKVFEDLEIPNTIQYIGNDLSLTDFSVTRIATHSFEKDNYIKTLKINTNMTSILDYAFSECANLKNVDVDDATLRIEAYAFKECKGLKNVTLGNKVTNISSYAFQDVPTSIYHSYSSAFYLGSKEQKFLYLIKASDTSASSIKIHQNTIMLCDACFSRCYKVKSLVIPNSVEYIGNYALYDMRTITNIIYEGNQDEFSSIKKGMRWSPINLESVSCVDGDITSF